MMFCLELVKVKGNGLSWAIKATINGVSRYRGYYYKKEAAEGLKEWYGLEPDLFVTEFHHNFHSAKELGISE